MKSTSAQKSGDAASTFSSTENATVKAGSNRLATERSPYLLQHKDNPIDWYSWGADAFLAAQQEDKPIFLSIGYATCHWCHVMAHESFEDEAVAARLNGDFICVKVDREERPDIDHIYMTATQIMTGSGGWPLTIIMTPDMQPFFTGTYIPKDARFGRPGLLELLAVVIEKWQSERARILESAQNLSSAVGQHGNFAAHDNPSRESLDTMFKSLADSFDPKHGGFGSGMKFPMAHNLLFLLRYFHRNPEPAALEMLETTLKHMHSGGIYDQLGYGFHRYATGADWLVPHFEKMLYDQGMMLWVYAEAYDAIGDQQYADVVNEIYMYLTRDMMGPQCLFYSAEDADSEGVEGKFYLWSKSEIEAALSPADSQLIIQKYNIEETGNFESDDAPRGANILHGSAPQSAFADFSGAYESIDDTVDAIGDAERKLLAIRSERVRPFLDDKVLTSWNGMVIGALAHAAATTQNDVYLETAQKAYDALLQNVELPDGTLRHVFRDGEAAVTGMLEDYAFVVFGCIELYLASHDVVYLKKAIALQHICDRLFKDSSDGAYFMSSVAQNDVPLRIKDFYDGAIPAGNSVAMYNLVRLARLTGDTQWELGAAKLSRRYAEQTDNAMYLIALDFAIGPSIEVVVVCDEVNDAVVDMMEQIGADYLPRMVFHLKTDENAEQLAQLAPFTAALQMRDNEPTAFMCRGHTCNTPTTSPEDFFAQLHCSV